MSDSQRARTWRVSRSRPAPARCWAPLTRSECPPSRRSPEGVVSGPPTATATNSIAASAWALLARPPD
eukprot:6561884-Lingulodinium_polyedra.AAC.1